MSRLLAKEIKRSWNECDDVVI